MPGIGKYKKGKAFSLRSGNKPSGFKMMGSSKTSPAKDLYIHRPDGNISKSSPVQAGEPSGTLSQ